jgi:nucleotide-binding universal stress UspA family protein
MTILIGYLPSPAGEAALSYGIDEAALRKTDAVIVNSPRRGSTVDGGLIDEEASQSLVARAAASGVTAKVDHALHGADIVEVFASLVARTGADLVVIGLRHRSPVGKLVMGSSAQRLLLELGVPILAVKATR